jgi:hypothetical protein
MQNEPNFQKSQMFITLISTTNYNEKSKMDTWSKQTQTKPICSELACPERGRRVEPILSAEALAKADSKGGQAGQANPCGQRFAD